MPTITKQTARPVAKPAANGVKSAWDMTAGIKMQLYGNSGTGKTTVWATFPGPILALICSGGNRPGELRSIDTPEFRKKIDARVVGSSDDYYKYLGDASNFATVVQDHATGLADLLLKEILGLDDFLLAKYRAAGKGESWSVVSQQQYGQLAIKCKEAFRGLLSIPQNVVIVAQERIFGGKDDGVPSDLITPTVGAALTPSVAGWLAPACDYVVQTFKRPKMTETTTKIGDKDVVTSTRGKGVEYCLRTGPHDVFQTKFRIPKGRNLPEYIVDPDYNKILKLIRG